MGPRPGSTGAGGHPPRTLHGQTRPGGGIDGPPPFNPPARSIPICSSSPAAPAASTPWRRRPPLQLGLGAGFSKWAPTWPLREGLNLSAEKVHRINSRSVRRWIPSWRTESRPFCPDGAKPGDQGIFRQKRLGPPRPVGGNPPGICTGPGQHNGHRLAAREQADAPGLRRVPGDGPATRLTFCPGSPHRATYWSIHHTLTLDNRQGIVCGDIGCYTLGFLPAGSSDGHRPIPWVRG